jgi:hypothetical protein
MQQKFRESFNWSIYRSAAGRYGSAKGVAIMRNEGGSSG